MSPLPFSPSDERPAHDAAETIAGLEPVLRSATIIDAGGTILQF